MTLVPNEALIAEPVSVTGAGGDVIDAYCAKPLGPGPYPGVVVIHHAPAWDDWSREVTRTFAAHGYVAISHHLFHREGVGAASWEDAASAARAGGGVSDDQFLGDTRGAIEYLRGLPECSGKVGVIGYCSGGRQSYIAACRLPIDAAVDAYGGSVVATPDQLTEKRPVAPIDMTADLACPILCLFGDEDANPDPAQREAIEAALTAAGKTFEIEHYPDAGHSFFATDRPAYRVAAATAGWERVFGFFGRYLKEG
jgi:carboxymethylenebutenolidase